MKIPALILTFLAATLLLTSANSQDGASAPAKEQSGTSSTKVKLLQQERIATLEAMSDVVATLYKQARATPQEVVEARLLLFHAQLEVAESPAERIEICEKTISVLKQYESLADAARQNVRGTASDVLRIKALRLEAEIRLEQAKAIAAGPV